MATNFDDEIGKPIVS